MSKLDVYPQLHQSPSFLFLLGQKSEDACLPVGRKDPPQRGRPKRPNINLAPIIFLSFLPTGKEADTHKVISQC
jgi:hypothetical protein